MNEETKEENWILFDDIECMMIEIGFRSYKNSDKSDKYRYIVIDPYHSIDLQELEEFRNTDPTLGRKIK